MHHWGRGENMQMWRSTEGISSFVVIENTFFYHRLQTHATAHSTKKLMTAGRPQQTSQPFEVTVWISDMSLAQYVMYICFTANLLNLHPTLSFQHPSRHWTDSFEAVNAMFMVTGPQCGARFSSGWFAAWLCISAEQAEEQQGWVQDAQPLVITSITATAGGLGNMGGCGCEVRS